MKSFFVVLITILGLATGTSAQNQIVKTNPLGLAFGNFNVKYERAFNQSSSFQIGANYLYKIFGVEVNSFGMDAEYRFYLTNRKMPAPEGFYVGPGVSYNFINPKDADGSASTLGIGATLGYQWIFGSGVTLEIGAGPQYNFVLVQSDALDDDEDFDFSGILPRIVFAVGYAF